MISELKVWKRITLGTSAANNFRQAFVEKRIPLERQSGKILDSNTFEICTEEIEFELVIATTKELTGTDEAYVFDVFDAIRNLGGLGCTDEVGPQLRLQYLDQPVGECLAISMTPKCVGSYHDAYVLTVNNECGELNISSNFCGEIFEHDIWHLEKNMPWVFMLPPKKLIEIYKKEIPTITDIETLFHYRKKIPIYPLEEIVDEKIDELLTDEMFSKINDSNVHDYYLKNTGYSTKAQKRIEKRIAEISKEIEK